MIFPRIVERAPGRPVKIESRARRLSSMRVVGTL